MLKKNFEKTFLLLLVVVFLSLMIINPVNAINTLSDECTVNSDCDDGSNLTSDICILKGPSVSNNYCVHYSFLKDFRCNSDDQCSVETPNGRGYHTEDVCEFNFNLGFRTCNHYLKSDYSCKSNDDCVDETTNKFYLCFGGFCNYFDKNYNIHGACNDNIPSFETHGSSIYNLTVDEGLEHYCRYSPIVKSISLDDCFSSSFVEGINFENQVGLIHLNKNLSSESSCDYITFDLCEKDSDCIDDNPYTVDSCDLIGDYYSSDFHVSKFFPSSGFNEKTCHHSLSSYLVCQTDAECFNMTPDNPYDLEFCSEYGYCLAYYDDSVDVLTGRRDFRTSNAEFNRFLNYVPVINFLGHLNNGSDEEFKIDVKTGRVSAGLSPDAFLLIEIHQDTFDDLVDYAYDEFNSKKIFYKRQGFFSKERFLLYVLLSSKRTLDDPLKKSSVLKINDWDYLFGKLNRLDLSDNEVHSSKNVISEQGTNLPLIS